VLPIARHRRSLIVSAVVLAMAAGCGMQAAANRPKPRPFDANAWRGVDPNNESDRETRGSMVDDLMEQKLLDGLTAAEVEELLGSSMPDSRRKSAGMDDESWQLCYHLGPTRDMLPIDEEFLMIRLDADGKVVTYRVIPN
jgi:hypothetical protein